MIEHNSVQLIEQKKASIVFMGETPRFANDNLGWIGMGDNLGSVDNTPYYALNSSTRVGSDKLVESRLGKTISFNQSVSH